MMHYPESVQRKLGILTRAGWVTASLRVPKLHTLADFVDTSGEFFRLSEAWLPHAEAALPFLALHRASAMFIVPLDGMQGFDVAPHTTPTTVHDVSCLFDHGVLAGKLEILTGVRVSDYLMHRGGFIPLANCSLQGAPYLPPEALQTFPLALVNRDRIVGVAEAPREPRLSIARPAGREAGKARRSAPSRPSPGPLRAPEEE